ncbi:MAG: CAP domain-containing protein [Actinomycetota bacterium]
MRAVLAAFLVLAVLAGTFGGVTPASASSASKMLHLTNGARKDRGLKPLNRSRKLSRLARENARSNSESETLVHSGSGKAENAGYGPSVRAVYKAFMNSGVHRKNILNGSFRRAGVGVISEDGYKWVTLIFA